MAERPSEGWVNLRLKPTFRANIYGRLERGMVILQHYRWKFSCKEIF